MNDTPDKPDDLDSLRTQNKKLRQVIGDLLEELEYYDWDDMDVPVAVAAVRAELNKEPPMA